MRLLLVLLLCLNCSGANVSTSNVGSVSVFPILKNEINSSFNSLVSQTNKSGSYTPIEVGLGTNSSVWTWPMNLSCVGYGASGFQVVLIATNIILTINHADTTGGSAYFKDTNGVSWTAYVSNKVNVLSDMSVCFLSNSAPSTIVIPYVFDHSITNCFHDHAFGIIPSVFVHRNTSSIDSIFVNAISDLGIASSINTGVSPFGNGQVATPGDSGSPVFTCLNGNPVLLFVQSNSGYPNGAFIASETYWSALTSIVPLSSLKVIDNKAFQNF